MSDHYFRVIVDCRTNTFVLRGELDRSSAEGLRETLAAVRAPTITLDLSLLSFIDSSGLACLAATAQHHPRGVLRGVRPRHRQLLDITRLRDEFEIEDPLLEVRSPNGSRNACPGPGNPNTTAPARTGPPARPLTSVLSVGLVGR